MSLRSPSIILSFTEIYSLYHQLLVCSAVFCFHSGVHQNQAICHLMSEMNQRLVFHICLVLFNMFLIFKKIKVLQVLQTKPSATANGHDTCKSKFCELPPAELEVGSWWIVSK